MPEIPIKKKRVASMVATEGTSTAASVSSSTAASVGTLTVASAGTSEKSPSIRTRTRKAAVQSYNFRPRSRNH